MNVKDFVRRITLKLNSNTKGSCTAFAELSADHIVHHKLSNFEIIEGYVTFDDFNNTFQHTWVTYKLQIIDPTLVQFSGCDLNDVQYKVKKKYTPEQYIELSKKHPIDLSESNTFDNKVKLITESSIFPIECIRYSPSLMFLYESNEVHDFRTNKTDDKFFAGTINNLLFLYDITDETHTYHSDFDNQIIVDTKNKQIEFPKSTIKSYIKGITVRDIYTGNKWYIDKIYKDLIKNNIIDNTYSIHHDMEKHYTSKDLILYHGTSSSVMDKIKKFGLIPQLTDNMNIDSFYRQNISTIFGHTEQNIYLSVNDGLAELYAKNQAEIRNDTPILITVQIPDTTKLLVDDDYINVRIDFVIGEMLEDFPRIKKITGELNIISTVFKNENTLLQLAQDKEETNILKQCIHTAKEEYNKLMKTNYVKSLISQYQAVAYRGRIPAKFLSFEEVFIYNPIVKESNFKIFTKKESNMNLIQNIINEHFLTELDEFGRDDITQDDTNQLDAFSKEPEDDSDLEKVDDKTPTETEIVKDKIRLLTIDRKNINKELKELLANPKSIFPLTQIKTIINKYDLTPIDDDGNEFEIKLKGTDGSIELTLSSKNAIISNSALIIYWHKNEDGTYNFNVYCS